MTIAFASFHQKTLTGSDLPAEFASETVVIRRLNEDRLADAMQAVQKKALKQVAEMGGADVLALQDKLIERNVDEATMAEAKARRAAAVEKVKRDPILAYDFATIVRLGVVRWSFKDADGKPVPITDESVADMLTPLRECLARAVFAFSVPDEDATKNESAPSSSN